MSYNFKIQRYLNEIQIAYFHNEITTGFKNEGGKYVKEIKEDIKDNKCDTKDNNTGYIDNKFRSIRRTKQTIYNLARSNHFDYFATFTFNNDVVDRFDYEKCRKKLTQFFNNFKKRKMPAFEYLAIPEQHKNGAWHFHALIQGDMSPYLRKSPYHKGRFIFTEFEKIGINEIESIRDLNRVCSYITKYITKALVDDMKDKRRFLYSKGLKKAPDELYFTDDDLQDFLIKYFPEYVISYAKHCDSSNGFISVDYVTLKKIKGQ